MGKKKIPKAVREQVWLAVNKTKFYASCYIPWCKNKISVFDFTVGHNIPESKGGTLCIDNLKPICARCNTSMGNKYTIDEWIDTYKHSKKYNRFLAWWKQLETLPHLFCIKIESP